MNEVTIVGGGLSGCEAAWQLADRGIAVKLIEMRPAVSTGAHKSGDLAEIVCSNSFKSTLLDSASGLLKAELAVLGSRLLGVASECRVPAGNSLAVDREMFSAKISSSLLDHPKTCIERKCCRTMDFPLPSIVATGPLTEEGFLHAMKDHFSSESLYFYDAISPSVDAGSVDMDVCFWGSRYGKGGPDYLNIPLSRDEYIKLLVSIRSADLFPAHHFEQEKYFEACLPIEVMVERGDDTLRFGPLKPKGLAHPKTGVEPYAVIQLRQEKRDGSLLGLVGFQTRMTRASQKKVIRSIPGLENVDILRFGAIHRNIFINTPEVCEPFQRDKKKKGLFYAGQICGVEGYVESIASGLIAALSTWALLQGKEMPALPEETITGSLMTYIHLSNRNFQPMNANFGILPLNQIRVRNRAARKRALAERALHAMKAYKRKYEWLFAPESSRSC